MITVGKMNSLIQAEIIYLNLQTIIGDGTDPRFPQNQDYHLVADTATVSDRTVYRIANERDGRTVWFGQNRVSDYLEVITAFDGEYDYIDKRGRIPNDKSEVLSFTFDQHYEAAKAVFGFLVHGNAHEQPYRY